MKKNHALIFYGLLVVLNVYFAIIGWPNPFCFVNIGLAVWMAVSAYKLARS